MKNHTKQRLTEEQLYHNAKITLDGFSNQSKEVPAKQEEVEKKMADKEAPEHVRVGSISVSIWTNNGEQGNFKTVTLQRGYKDKDGNWQNTTSLKANDIPKAILALQKAYENIVLKEA